MLASGEKTSRGASPTGGLSCRVAPAPISVGWLPSAPTSKVHGADLRCISNRQSFYGNGPEAEFRHGSKIVCAIGEKAGVIVNREQEKFASAHDLRRAFGNRWASKVMPVVLQKLMRHESIETTLNYYVSFQTDDIARQLWSADELRRLPDGDVEV